ncbi:threonine/serine exporter family protein [Klebsiella pneumoniae]|nr:threonine/serine exporter family protein [Klebsiella pneumoniae]
MVGLSCACFCKLNNALGWGAGQLRASTAAMYICQVLTHRSMHPQINFCITALSPPPPSPAAAAPPGVCQHADYCAMAASVLPLVPGFPLINAVADMFKGYQYRTRPLGDRQPITLATCIGVVMAMTVWGLRGWA